MFPPGFWKGAAVRLDLVEARRKERSVAEAKRKESGLRARVAGKEDVKRRTAWTLDVGKFVFRCVEFPDRPGEYAVQIREMTGQWQPIREVSRDPQELLRKLVNLPSFGKIFDR